MTGQLADLKPGDAQLIADLDDLLPQTQCTQCGFAGCLPYARAIVLEGAPINRCPPGGAAGVIRLAQRSGRPVLPLDPACGPERPRQVAQVAAELCIGCTLCIQACPVDAIAGANKHLHAVIPELCTGCRLCVAPCPVDCITMVDPAPGTPTWSADDAAVARQRHRRQQQRRQATAPAALATTPESAAPLPRAQGDAAERRKQALLEAVMQRARSRLAGDSHA